jgi:diguanylate cyclase (GGDEF)-like protein
MSEREQEHGSGLAHPTASESSANRSAGSINHDLSRQNDLERKASLVRSAALLIVVLTLRPQVLQPQYSRLFVPLVVAGCIYILAAGLMPLGVRDPRRFTYIVLTLDLIFVTLIVQVTGGIFSGYLALYFLPVLRASATMRLRDGMATTALAILLTWYLAVLARSSEPLFWRLVLIDGLLVAVALFFGLLARETRNYRLALSRLDEAHKKLQEQAVLLRELAIRDSLTGLYDRRYFDDRLNDELVRARRYNRPLSVLLIEVNGLRRLNNARGTAAGDAALKRIADALGANCRSVDVVARYGGDGFAVLLPETGPEGAAALAARIRGFTADDPDGLWLSLGFASYPSNGTSAVELIKAADAALTKDREGRHGSKTKNAV